jgi:Fe-Mn family superoxide dismutase
VTVEEVQAMLASGTPVQILDTRPKHHSSRSHEIIVGAVWRDPARVNLSSHASTRGNEDHTFEL